MLIARDFEQHLPGLTITDYPDLYILGACPDNRRQKQILHEDDDCCFDRDEYEAGPAFDIPVTVWATNLNGDYDLVWKEKTTHQWYTDIIADEVLSEL